MRGRFTYLIITEDYFIDLSLEIEAFELMLHCISELSSGKQPRVLPTVGMDGHTIEKRLDRREGIWQAGYRILVELYSQLMREDWERTIVPLEVRILGFE